MIYELKRMLLGLILMAPVGLLLDTLLYIAHGAERPISVSIWSFVTGAALAQIGYILAGIVLNKSIIKDNGKVQN